MYSEKFLKSSIKLLRSSFPVMLQTFLTRRALKMYLSTQRLLQLHSKATRGALQGHSKGTPKTLQTRSKSTPRALWHLGTWALRHFGTRALGEHLGTQTLKHFGTRAIEGYLGTRGTLFSRIRLTVNRLTVIKEHTQKSCSSNIM